MKTVKLLNTDRVALIDDEDWDRVTHELNSWGIAGGGYVVTTDHHGARGQIRLHRMVMNYPDMMIDHVDGNPLNCQKANLRLCNKSQNAVNTPKKDMSAYVGAKRKSKYKGVYWSWRNGKWLAQIGYNFRVIYGGYFESENDAAMKANELYSKHHGEFAKLNVIG